MNSKRPEKWILFFLILIIITAFCAQKKENKQIPDIVSLEDVEILELRDSLLDILISVLVKNNSIIGATLIEADATISLNGTEIGMVKSNQTFKLGAKDTALVQIPGTIYLSNFSTKFPQIMEQESTPITIFGDFKVKVAGITTNLRRKLTESFDFQSEIQKQIKTSLADNMVRIKDLRPKKVGLFSSEITMSILSKNPLGIDILLNEMDLDLFMKGQNTPFGDWQLGTPVTLSAQSEFMLNADVSLNNQTTMIQGFSALFKEKEITASGTAQVSIGNYPFRIPIQHKLSPKDVKLFD